MTPVVLLIIALVLGGPSTVFNPREFARNHGGIMRLSIATGNTGGRLLPVTAADSPRS